MHWIFRAVTERLKALFVADVALDFEAQLVSRQAERKAQLLQQADAFEQRGLDSVAADLRVRAEQINLDRPLASVLPAMSELSGEEQDPPLLLTPTATARNGGQVVKKRIAKKKGRRS